MEISPEHPVTPDRRPRVVRIVAVTLAAVAALVLAFGLGYGAGDLAQDDREVFAEAPAERWDYDGVDEPGAEAGAQEDDAPERSLLEVGGAILAESFAILEREFVDKEILDERSFLDAAIRGALDSLNDSYTEYISPHDRARGGVDIESTYEGIGASVTDRDGAIQIVAPFRGSPAEAAGIRAGDIILAVDGDSTEGWTTQQAVQRIRGPRGADVVLTVQHTDLATGGAGPEIEDITVTRGEILIQSVFTEPLREVIPGESGDAIVDREGKAADDVFYLNISQFHSETPAELDAILRDADLSRYRGMIIDVRGNPGGFLRQTIQTTNAFLKEGAVILIEIDADGESQTYGAVAGGRATAIPIVVLQDKASASGAEVLAAALADNGRAVIVGERSFGKGTVNRLHELEHCGDPDGCGALYVSIGRWQRPNGQVIEGLGIAPDYDLPLSGDDYIDFGDLQLFAAIDILRGLEPPPLPERDEDGELVDGDEDEDEDEDGDE